ncbi:MAG: patatin-like phospholipase family protein [Chromatiales bacterium]|nr:patatin-like phospholipase family protein [Chromatiales bacterium]
MITNSVNRLLVVLLLLVLTGCASTARFPDNPALANVNSMPVERKANRQDNDILLAMTFSGGGSRASALAYGVLEELKHTPVSTNESHRLTDEIDLISSVSGGSITAAYYGLYGDKLFTDFRRDFLEQDIESELTSKTFSPVTLSRLTSPTFGTGDVLDEFFSSKLFAGASIDKLLDGDGPQVQINATDLFKGGSFGFTQEQFALICSDPAQFPISRAVAASCAVPIIFSPVTMSNRAGSCGHVPPAWFYTALLEDGSNPRRHQRARLLSAYLDQENHPYIHLLDGGLTDNLGLRALIDKLIEEDGMWNTLKRFEQHNVKHIAIIVVNAASVTPSQWELQNTNPPDSAVIDAATTIPLVNYNFETLEYFRQNLPDWQREIVEGQCQDQAPCSDQPIYLIEVNLQDIADEALRKELTQVPTGFTLPEGSAKKLITAGRTLLRQHPEFIRLIENLAER